MDKYYVWTLVSHSLCELIYLIKCFINDFKNMDVKCLNFCRNIFFQMKFGNPN